jgi:hypothetical protein
MIPENRLPSASLAVLVGMSVLLAAHPAVAAEVEDLSLDDLINTKITTASKFSTGTFAQSMVRTIFPLFQPAATPVLNVLSPEFRPVSRRHCSPLRKRRTWHGATRSVQMVALDAYTTSAPATLRCRN